MPDQVLDAEVVPDDEHGTALAVADQPSGGVSLFGSNDPVEIIEQATRVANALKSVVSSRDLISKIRGREHPKVEAWQTLGSMLAVSPVPVWVRAVPWPDPVPECLKEFHARGMEFGFEASMSAQRPDGTILGGGEATCRRTESTWRDRDDYALESMAQTRAISKCLKGPLGFVMVLAGYESTPAEEMPNEQAADILPLGPRASEQAFTQAKHACIVLAHGDMDVAGELFGKVTADCGGYLPAAAVLALTRAAAVIDPTAIQSEVQ